MSEKMLCIVALSWTLAGTAAIAQETVSNPFPEKIPVGDLAVSLQPVAQGFVAPVQLTHAGDGSGRLFVVDQPGRIHVIVNGQLRATPFLDITERVVKLQSGFDERGLLGLAFHPDFTKPGTPGYRKLYTYHSAEPGETAFPLRETTDKDGNVVPVPVNNLSVLTEWQVSAKDPNVVDKATGRVVLTFAQPQFNHDGGAIVFDRNKLLFIGTGDGGAGNDLGPGHAEVGNGQALDTLLGKVLRIDPLGLQGKKKDGYSVPEDNPFVGKDGLEEIYAYGFRNPWRMSYDAPTDRMIAADVGQSFIEEIDIVQRGGNYGWPIKEGTFYFHRSGEKLSQISREPLSGDLPEMIDPVAQYDHDEGISITGGHVYRGKAIAPLAGRYVFGEWIKPGAQPDGRLFHVDLEDGKIVEFAIPASKGAVGGFVIGFGEDEAGELYVLTCTSRGPNTTSGMVYKISPVK